VIRKNSVIINKPKGFSMASKTFQPTSLDCEFRASVDTETAAFHLNRAQQTLRIWACRENGPLRPIRVQGRLHWKTDDLRRLLGVRIYGPTGVAQ
jgi:hypothetical protein